MSSSFTVLNLGSGGDNIAMEAVTYGGAPTTRKRNHSVITGTTELAIADVANAAPATSAYGVTVRGLVGGDVASDSPDANAPVKIGMKAVENLYLSSVDLNDRVDWRGDRRGVPHVQLRSQRGKGGFIVSAQSGSMAAGLAADSEIFQFRYGGDAGVTIALIRKVLITHFVSTTAFTAGAFRFVLKQATGWSANGSGGTSIVSGVPKRDARGTNDTTLNDMRIASTAALGAGTKTLVTQMVSHAAGYVPNTVGTHLGEAGVRLFDSHTGVEPMIIGNNNGLAILATVPATGVWTFGVTVEWDEAYPYEIGQSN